MRFCIKCGREFEDRFIVKEYGLCIDCFIESRGIFREKPVVNITYCPKCGSILVGNKWTNPSELNVIKKHIERELKKRLDPNVVLIDVGVRVESIYTEGPVVTPIKFSINGYEKTINYGLNINSSRRMCPKCFSQKVGSFKVLIQFRAEDGDIEREELNVIKNILSEPDLAEEIVEVKEDKNGLDVKLSSLNAARRVVKKLNKIINVKVIETFKSKKYNAQKGIWLGETVISIRLPKIKPNVIVDYGGRVGLIKEVKPNEIVIEDLSDGSIFKVSSESYWKGDIRILGDLKDYREMRIIGYDSSTVYLLNDKTGEIIECPINPNTKFNVNDVVYLVEINGRKIIVKNKTQP